MIATVALSALLWVSAAADEGPRTVWLVQPLYPGQEVLVGRTEEAIDKLMPKEGRSREIIGKKELAAALAGRAPDLGCLFGEKACADPIDALVGGFGFDRVVLVRGGQDESGYHFKVVSYRPATGEATPSEATSPGLERALLGALVKVVPLASSLEVRSTPGGATVFIDGVKVGLTPLSTQVLPGERVIKIDLRSHQPIEESLVVPVRGSTTFERKLEKIAARVTISASPAGTEIFIDGASVGRDKIDRGIQPGQHSVRLAHEGYKAVELMFDVKPDESYTLDKGLEPILAPKAPEPAPAGGAAGPKAAPAVAVPVTLAAQPQPVAAVPAPAPPPAPLSIDEQIYERKSYFHVGFEQPTLKGGLFDAVRTEGSSRTAEIVSGSRGMIGATMEYGTLGRHFGVALIGLSYAQGVAEPWTFRVSQPYTKPVDRVDVTKEFIAAKVQLLTVRLLQPQFRWVFWRFTVAVQAGLEGRGGRILEAAATPFYVNGFIPLDLMVSVRGTLKVALVDGLYVYGAYGTSFSVLSTNAGMKGLNGGLGYAF